MVNDDDGLYIRVWPNGSKTWVLLRKVNGTSKYSTLGLCSTLSAKRARIAAALKRDTDSLVSDATAATTFGDLLAKYYREQIENSYRRPEQDEDS